jgi:hypothetical protein
MRFVPTILPGWAQAKRAGNNFLPSLCILFVRQYGGANYGLHAEKRPFQGGGLREFPDISMD